MKYVLICLACAIVFSSILINVVLWWRYNELELDNNACKAHLGEAYYAALYNDAGVDKCIGLVRDAIEIIDERDVRLRKCQGFK